MRADWYFDFISPFAFLQLPRVLALRARVEIVPVPIVFGAVLAHHGQLGPAEIAAKRAFTYRYVQWQADRAGIALRFPPAHPFNPLAALRLCVAAGGGWDAVSRIFAHFWRDGASGVDAGELAEVAQVIGVADAAAAIASDAVKATLRENTGRALAAGVFGVWSWRDRATATSSQPAAAERIVMVLPVEVRGGDRTAAWIRLGAMDFLAAGLRGHADLKV
ncbi:MAG TPA: DsbA family protein, partial [Dokdonella sp.]